MQKSYEYMIEELSEVIHVCRKFSKRDSHRFDKAEGYAWAIADMFDKDPKDVYHEAANFIKKA